MLARNHLNAARAEVTDLRGSASPDEVRGRIAAVQRHAAAARSLTSDPVWSLAAKVPIVGRTLRTSAGVAAAVDVVAREVLPTVGTVAEQLTAKPLWRPEGAVALDQIAAVRPPLLDARDVLARTQRDVRGLPDRLVLGTVAAARADLLAELDRVHAATTTAADLADVATAMLGEDEPRRYLVAILNNAEMRGSGGMLGGFAVLEVHRGRPRLREVAPNDQLRPAARPVVDLGPEFATRYGRFSSTTYWQNANMSPHFPHAARIWLGLWANNRGERLDGVLAVDPVAMSKLLAVTGPVVLRSGERITADNVVDRLENTVYLRFPADAKARGGYLVEVANGFYRALLDVRDTDGGLVRALWAAVASRHVQLASARPAEQAVLERTAVAGVLPEATPGRAFLLVTTQNAGGNKLDYYLRRQVRYRRVSDTEVAVEVTLTNLARAGLPTYVAGRLDLAPDAAPAPPGEQHLYLSLFGAQGALLVEATRNGQRINMESERERGHPVYSTFVKVRPGAPVTVRLRLRDTTSGAPLVVQPPLVVPDQVTVDPR